MNTRGMNPAQFSDLMAHLQADLDTTYAVLQQAHTGNAISSYSTAQRNWVEAYVDYMIPDENEFGRLASSFRDTFFTKNSTYPTLTTTYYVMSELIKTAKTRCNSTEISDRNFEINQDDINTLVSRFSSAIADPNVYIEKKDLDR